MVKRKIVVAVAMHNNSNEIRRCLISILRQVNIERQIHIVIGNDNSFDDWKSQIEDILHINHKVISILNLNNSNVVKTRNEINTYILKNLTEVDLIARLDADDEYSNADVLSKIEQIFNSNSPDLILAGNYLRLNNTIISRVNKSSRKLLDKKYLKDRVFNMSQGDSNAELPSCNLFIKPSVLIPYPNIESGEDHLLLIKYLLSNTYKWHFAEEILAVNYNLNGSTTLSNKKKNTYISCREEMYNMLLLNE
ncbi:glycosyltransferase family A protein [uncultured Lutibacter sp.]|uniref:glycosyltransferase family 2 protein n=1 Tax=uncultured Lutibacter sp. TaxID=437739 RepID=UPI00263603FD|nr:glycosyltransferase family A protein [uncultured Lutibacter sp.]